MRRCHDEAGTHRCRRLNDRLFDRLAEEGLAIIGRVQGVPSLYIAVMHSGIMLAPAVGEFVADEVLGGRRDVLLSPFGFERLRWRTRCEGGIRCGEACPPQGLYWPFLLGRSPAMSASFRQT